MDELQLAHARQLLQHNGPDAVSAYMDRLNHLFGPAHYLLDAQGVDVVSGGNRSAFLPVAPARKSRGYLNGRLVITHESSDGRYWFVAVNPREPNRWTFFPYYLLVLAVAGILVWLAAIGVISPIRKITAAVDRFGAGDMHARVISHRQDEIGDLARSFNGMADRLHTLLVSERRLLEDISHELRSPLARLNLAVRLARTAQDPPMAFDRVQRQISRITLLISEIVELTRLEGDPLARKDEKIGLMDLIQETVTDCRLEAEVRGCSVELEGHIQSEISGDRELLRRAVENVLRNAIRYSPEGAAIDVKVGENADRATISIRDYGPGVPDAALAHIFAPFFRVEAARDTETGGMGLGLSIARRALLLHGGTVTAYNAAPGLRVNIVIPLKSGFGDGSGRHGVPPLG